MSPVQSTIAIAGRIESGKSSVSSLLSAELGIPVLSFGAYVRSTCPPGESREGLQVAGSQLLENLGAAGLIGAVLESQDLDSTGPAIWEGLRHRTVLEALRVTYAPIPVSLFFLNPPEDQRRARAEHTAGGPQRLAIWEAHETEAIAALAADARLDLRVGSPEAAAAEILAELG